LILFSSSSLYKTISRSNRSTIYFSTSSVISSAEILGLYATNPHNSSSTHGRTIDKKSP